MSVAVASSSRTSSSHSAVMSAGQVISGGVVSSMVIVCSQVAMLPQASTAAQTMVRISGHEPAVSSLMMSTPGFGSQLSVAVAVPIA